LPAKPWKPNRAGSYSGSILLRTTPELAEFRVVEELFAVKEGFFSSDGEVLKCGFGAVPLCEVPK
jgi:hypothetical protein